MDPRRQYDLFVPQNPKTPAHLVENNNDNSTIGSLKFSIVTESKNEPNNYYSVKCFCSSASSSGNHLSIDIFDLGYALYNKRCILFLVAFATFAVEGVSK